MGDIGPVRKEIEVLPARAPMHEPTPESAPIVAPEPELVPA